MFERLRIVGKNFKREIKIYQRVARDKRTPLLPKLLLGLAVGYALMPFDIIPDFVPLIGHLDDIIIIPALIILALKLIPKEIVEEHATAMKVNPS